jgi:hypothetical protein
MSSMDRRGFLKGLLASLLAPVVVPRFRQPAIPEPIDSAPQIRPTVPVRKSWWRYTPGDNPHIKIRIGDVWYYVLTPEPRPSYTEIDLHVSEPREHFFARGSDRPAITKRWPWIYRCAYCGNAWSSPYANSCASCGAPYTQEQVNLVQRDAAYRGELGIISSMAEDLRQAERDLLVW